MKENWRKCCPSCGNRLEESTRFCPNCGQRLQGNESPRLLDRDRELPQVATTQESNMRNLISIGAGRVKLKSRDEIALWYVDSSGKICIAIIPRIVYAKIDAATNTCASRDPVAATIGCIGIDTEYPALSTALLPIDEYADLSIVSGLVGKGLEPASQGFDVSGLFNSVQFVGSDDPESTIRLMRRVGKNPQQGDRFTTIRDGKRVEIYHTCMLGHELKPWSFTEMVKLKAMDFLP